MKENLLIFGLFFSLIAKPVYSHDVQDPFDRILNLQEQMRREMEMAFSSGFPQSLENSNSFQVSQREDAQFKYIDIFTGKDEAPNLNIKIENGRVSISGTSQEKDENHSDSGMSTSHFFSSFSQSLTVPPDVVEEQAQIENQKGRVVIKFPKKMI